MAVQLNHSSNNGELSLSAWKELDMKFLSNDTATSAQKMLQSVTPIDRLDHILNHSSLYIRASDLTIYLENVGSIHLKQHYQLIVEAIFGQNSKYPSWALRSITKSSNPREAAVILRLLGATGSLLSLATSLLEDPGFMVEVGLDRLPFALSQRILQGDVPPYFSTRLCVTDPFQQASPMIKCLRVNSFEYFFLSYASHICALKGLGFTSDYLVGWGTMTDNLYNNLLDDYLVYFFPCTGAGVPCDNFRLSYQQANDSLYLGQTLSSRLLNSPASGNSCTSMSPRLLKASVLMEQPHLSGGGGDSFFRKGRSHKEVWRTETIWLICTEIWMAHAPGVTPYQNCSPTSTDQVNYFIKYFIIFYKKKENNSILNTKNHLYNNLIFLVWKSGASYRRRCQICANAGEALPFLSQLHHLPHDASNGGTEEVNLCFQNQTKRYLSTYS